jgi:hypothetical protein
MKLKQVVLSIENSPKRLYEVTKALGDAGINLRALNLVDTGAFGQVRLLVSDVKKTRQILMQMQMPAYVNDVVAVQIDDTPGQLAEILKPLTDAGVLVKYTYALTGFSPDKAVMIFRFSDNDKAITVLEKEGKKILDAKAFGIM